MNGSNIIDLTEQEERRVVNYKSISCERIPELFLDKLVAKNHFGKFGKISRFILRPNRFSCTVEYESEKNAANAYENAGNFNGYKFDVDYSTMEKSHVQNTEEWVNPDVQAELDAMDTSRMRSSMRIPQFLLKVPQQPQTQSAEGFVRSQPDAKSSSTFKADSNFRSELESILRRPALSDEDKYRVLDARDKLMRLKSIRETDIKKATRTKGTCPDMCPEKERFMREFQRQVSIFEMESGSRNTMNHRKAIKEYSRSSADQEAPLSHELRPENVLKMTMLYLMHRIMDLCNDPDVSIGDWFHFVWDRTRSVRKDITQQELCSPGAVELVEQCARFHIHCAARLVAEDSSIFDQKINTENLTKCLQTLKYMYHDLRLKNVGCSHEAEFRSYVILLNLNDSNFLWETKQLPEDIQNSSEMRTAIDFYKIMESNNYVRFFMLVRQTNYMNACILLRYFTQVRLRALRTMIKAYNWGKNAVSLNLDYLVNVLGFESEKSAKRFFNFYNLDCDDDKVLLDKTTFYVPDVPFSMERAMMLVESKLTSSVGECVYGQPLPSTDIFEDHVPHNSFDSNCLLKLISYAAEDQMTDRAQAREKQIQQQPQKDSSNNIFKIPRASPPPVARQFNFKQFANISKDESDSSKTMNVFQQKSDKPLLATDALKNKTSTPFFSLSNPFLKANNTLSASKTIFPKPQNAFGELQSKQDSDNSKLFTTNIFKSIQPQRFPSSASSANTEIATPQNFIPKIRNNDDPRKTFSFSNTNITKPPVQLNEQSKQEVNKHQLNSSNFSEIKQPEMENIAKKVENKSLFKPSAQIVHNFVGNVPKLTATDVIEKIVPNEQSVRNLQEIDAQERKKQEIMIKRKAISQRAENLLKGILYEVQQHIIRQEAENQLRSAFHQNAIQLKNQLIEEYVHEFVTNNMILLKYFNSWYNRTRRKVMQREIISNTPIWMTIHTRDEQAYEFAHPAAMENLQMMRRYRMGQPCNFSQLLQSGGDIEYPEKINIFSILASNLKESHTKRSLHKQWQYFKICILLPGGVEESPIVTYLMNQWMNTCIYRPPQKTEENGFICNAESGIALSVRKITHTNLMNEIGEKVTKECDNSNSSIFVMCSDNIGKSRKRLHHLLKLSRNYRKIPIAIIVFCFNYAVEESIIVDKLQLENFKMDDKISNYKIFQIIGYPQNNTLNIIFTKALSFIARQSAINDHSANDLVMQRTETFLIESLGDDIWRRFHESSLINPLFYKICTIPKYVVALYNQAIDHIIDILSEDVDDMPEFPDELRQFVPKNMLDVPLGMEYFPSDWKNPSRLIQVVKSFKKLKMIEIDESCVPNELHELQNWILNYANKCITEDDKLAFRSGCNAIKNLIENLNCQIANENELVEKLKNISWLSVMKPIAQGLLQDMWLNERCSLPNEIIYQQQKFTQFRDVPWWLNCDTVQRVKIIQEKIDNTKTAEKDNSALSNDSYDVESILKMGYKASRRAEEKLQSMRRTGFLTLQEKQNESLNREMQSTLYDFESEQKDLDRLHSDITYDADDMLADIDTPPPMKKSKLENDQPLKFENDDDVMKSVLDNAFALIEKIDRERDELNFFLQ